MNNHQRGYTSEIFLWAIGVALLVLYFGARIDGEFGREQAITAFVQARASINPSPGEVTPGSDTGQDESHAPPMAASEITPPLRMMSDRGSDAAQVSPGSDTLPIALLRIGRVGLEVPVFADTSELNLNRGAGWVKGTAAPDDGGNMAIAAHRDGYFRVLKDVAVGDVLELESISKQQDYRVVELSIVEPEDVSPLYATDTSAVTLVTCYPFYFVGHAPQRYVVRAVAMQ
jgi:sortase A